MDTTATSTGISLVKGQKVDLSKDAPSMQKAYIGLGWDTNKSHSNSDIDLYTSCFMVGDDGKTSNEKNLVYFHNPKSICQSVKYEEGSSDSDNFNIDFSTIPADVEQIVFVVSILSADSRRQNFGHVKNMFIHLADTDTKQEILKYELLEDYSTATAIQFGKLYRHNDVWKFEASGNGESAGLQKFLAEFQ